MIRLAFDTEGSDLDRLIAACTAASLIADQRREIGEVWVEVPADLFFRASTRTVSKDRPDTILEVVVRRFPDLAGVRVAGRTEGPISPSILEVAPTWLIEKKPGLPNFQALTEKLLECWRAQVEAVIAATPPGAFALFSSPALEGQEMRFRLAYLPAAMYPTQKSPIPGLDPALSWHVGPIRTEVSGG